VSEKEKKPPSESDLLFWDGALGMYLRDARNRAGLSLRDLERTTGVSDSEIHKIETGSQECRLSSFVKVCSALGVPGGLVLDQVVSSSFAYFSHVLLKDDELRGFSVKRWKANDFSHRVVTDQLACFSSVAAHLLRCSHATRKAKSFDYPAPTVGSAFLTFAATVDNTGEGLERLSILSALQHTPFQELERQRLLCLDYLDDLVQKANRARIPKSIVQSLEFARKGIGGVPMWWPLPAPESPFTKKR
jgi:transcriptional regulator with XRE-family HTH domain